MVGAVILFGATLGGATAIGLVGGVLTDTLGWRSIFFINLPIGLAAFAVGSAQLHESRDPTGGLNEVLLAAAAFAALGAIIGFAFGPDPAGQPQPTPAQHQAQRLHETNRTITSSRHRRRPVGSP